MRQQPVGITIYYSMVIESDDLGHIRHDLEDATIALRFGAYDILHVGHRESLAYAATLADILVVGVLPDDYLSRKKGHDRPLIPECERAASVAEAESVSYSFVAPGSTLGLARAMHALRPDVYVEPREHASTARLLKTGYLRLLGIDYVIDNRHSTESSSLIIERLGRAGAIACSSFDFRLDDAIKHHPQE